MKQFSIQNLIINAYIIKQLIEHLIKYTNKYRFQKTLNILFIRKRQGQFLERLIESLRLSTLGFSNHHSDFLHWVMETFPGVPTDPFAKRCVSILPVEIWSVADIILPSPSIKWTTVIRPVIVVHVVRTKGHSVMEQHTVSWNIQVRFLTTVIIYEVCFRIHCKQCVIHSSM